MADFLSGLAGAAGLAGAIYMGRQRRAERLADTNASRLKLGLPPIEDKPAPIDKAIAWMKSKFDSTPQAPATPTTPVTAPTAPTGENVGLWERLKAGNIDAPGSEAYNRWGQGKVAGDAAALARESVRTSPGETTQTTSPVTLEQQAAAPVAMAASLQGAKDGVQAVSDLDESTRLAAEQSNNAKVEGQTFDPHEASQSQFSKYQWENTPDPVLSNPVNQGMDELPDM